MISISFIISLFVFKRMIYAPGWNPCKGNLTVCEPALQYTWWIKWCSSRPPVSKMYATQSKLDSYYQAQPGWRSKAHSVGTHFIPATSPGFNDTGVRDGHTPLSRKLTATSEFGSLFQAMVDKAITLVDKETGNLFLVTSWNEWHEDTQIEPVTVAGPTSVDNSVSGEAYTFGMEYEGYGTRYLDILKEKVEGTMVK